MKNSNSALLRSILALLPASLLPATGFAMGHGPTLSIEHFNTKPATVWLNIHSHQQMPRPLSGKIAQFEMGSGRQLQILKSRPQGGHGTLIEVPWPVGHTLAFVEGHAPTEGRLLAGLKYRGLYLMKSEEAVRLQKDARNFVWPVSMEDAQSELKSETVERGTTPTQPVPPPWQPRAISKAEALQPDLERLMQTLEVLTGDRTFTIDGKEVRITERGGTENRNLTQKFVMQTLQDLGIETRLAPYTQSGYNGSNVEGTLWGADRSRFIIVSAHMDSVRNRGADDDGSGTAAFLEAARLLASKPNLPVSIRFVGFDQEELGLIGSRAYANQLKPQEKILGVLQADMIGYDSNGDFAYHVMDCDRPDSRPLTRVVEELNTNLSLGMKKVAACTNRSDHASFWNKNIPALILSESFFGNDSNPCYHQKCDLIDKINKEYMLRLTSLQVNTALSLALSAN